MRLLGPQAITFAAVSHRKLSYLDESGAITEDTLENINIKRSQMIGKEQPLQVFLEVGKPVGQHDDCEGLIVSDADSIADAEDETWWNFRCTKCLTTFQDTNEF